MGLIAGATAVAQLLPALKSTLGRWLEDKDQVNAIAAEWEQSALSVMRETDAAQIEVNKLDAKSGNLWQSGWRPYAGWGSVTLFLVAHGAPLMAALFGFPEVAATVHKYADPAADTLLMGMLGMTSYRTVERMRGKRT